MRGTTCERCGGESWAGAWCTACLWLTLALAGQNPPDDEAAAVYYTPNCVVALYADGRTRRWDGERWSDTSQTWPPKAGMQMLEQQKRRPEFLTDVGRRALGLVEQTTLF